MAGKPDLPKGYLGPQAKFSEFGLATVNYKEPEISTYKNQVSSFYFNKM